MRRPRNSLARAGGVAVCTCALAAGLVVVPDVASPPRAVPPTAAFAAVSKPLTATVPDLVAHVRQFAALVDPLVTENAAPQQYSAAAATATPGLATSVVGTTIANGVFRVAAVTIRAVVAVLSPFVYNPVIGQPVGAAIIITLFGGGLAAAAVASVILQVDQAMSSLVGFVGSALGRILRLPAALLRGATGLAAATAVPGPAARTATAFSVDTRAARTADEPDIPSAPQAPRRDDVDIQPPADAVSTPAPKDDPAPVEPETPDVSAPATGDTPAATEPSPDAPEPPAAPVNPRTKIRHSHGNAERGSRDSAGPTTSHKKNPKAASRPEAPSSAGDTSAPDSAEG